MTAPPETWSAPPAPTIDALTGLPTHVAVADLLADGARPFAVFFDIDALRRITEADGHAASDRVLVEVATIIDQAARDQPQGSAFRIAGDEFLVVLPAATHAQAVEFATGLIARVVEVAIDGSTQRPVSLNAAVSRISAALTARVWEAREWSAGQVWRARQHDSARTRVVADAGETLPRWAG